MHVKRTTFATLVGYGANAVNPYLVIETMVELQRTKKLDPETSISELFENYRKSINGGLLKIFSKMGISTLQSYHGAQIFEALGISKSVVEKYFTGTVSRIQALPSMISPKKSWFVTVLVSQHVKFQFKFLMWVGLSVETAW